MTDAREVLGVAVNAGDEEIRAAYLRKVKEYPPERAPKEFEQIRDAFETLRDPRKRIRTMLLSTDPLSNFARLLDDRPPKRLFAGPKPWREAIKAK